MYSDEAVIGCCSNEASAATAPAQAVPAAVHSALSFDELFDRYQGMVYQLVFRVLGDREEALDVAQEVFLAIHSKLDRFRGESSLKTWIYRIALNRASNRCRWWNRLRRRGSVSLDGHLSRDQDQALSDTLISKERSPEDCLLARERRDLISHSLRRLPVDQRIAVVLRDMEGFSYEEIAATTRASLGTVKSRIARGRDDLRKRLNGMLEQRS